MRLIQRSASSFLWLYFLLSVSAQALVVPLSRRDAVLAAATTAGTSSSSSLLIGASPPTSQPTSVLLEDKYEFPLVSFGLQIYDDATAYKLTMTALEVGYRNFFASVLARNQKGFAKAVRDSGIPRDQLFICGSVVSNRARGYDAARIATTQGWQANMNAFAAGNIDYLDQIMLDYPGPDVASIRGQWKAFEDMRNEQLVRTLSVSNFDGPQLDAILLDPAQQHTYRPVVNQLPYSVAYHPSVLRANQQRNILVQAWAPLGGSLGGRFNARIRQACADIGATKKGTKSAYQVALRWVLQQGVAVCTQTTKREHFVEDLNIFDFTLTADEMKTLEQLA